MIPDLGYLGDFVIKDGLYQHTFSVNVLRNIRSSYVRNMMENMTLTSYVGRSYFVAS